MRRLFKLSFPRQFWLMFVGMLISTIGSSMIWPFLMIYVSERLGLPLTFTAMLLTLNSVMGLISSFIAGPIIDRLGRKWVMVGSLLMNGVGFLLMSQADSLLAFALIMGLQGAVNPLFRVGGDAMMADLIPADDRADAYSLMRLSNNVGVAIGPAVGGFLASASYNLAFYGAAIGLTFYGLLLAFKARETLPELHPEQIAQAARERFGGYGKVLADKPYRAFVLSFLFTQFSASILWVMLSVYTKTNFALPESRYGLIPMTNALMVVAFQIPVTMWTKQQKPHTMMALGAFFYAIGVGSVALAGGFWGFWLSMVIMTIGELVLVPTTSTYAANLAPAHMRGRYMSIYGLTWNVAHGTGPVVGGLLNDTFGPRSMWYGGGVTGLISTALFMLLARTREKEVVTVAGETK